MECHCQGTRTETRCCQLALKRQVAAGLPKAMCNKVKNSVPTNLKLVQKVLQDEHLGTSYGDKVQNFWHRQPPNQNEDPLDWIEWSKKMQHSVPKQSDAQMQLDYHRVADADSDFISEIKWLDTLLHDAGVQTDLQSKLSQYNESEVRLWLCVTFEPCNFCTRMLLLHHSELEKLYAQKPGQSLKIMVVAQTPYRNSPAQATSK